MFTRRCQRRRPSPSRPPPSSGEPPPRARGGQRCCWGQPCVQGLSRKRHNNIVHKIRTTIKVFAASGVKLACATKVILRRGGGTTVYNPQVSQQKKRTGLGVDEAADVELALVGAATLDLSLLLGALLNLGRLVLDLTGTSKGAVHLA